MHVLVDVGFVVMFIVASFSKGGIIAIYTMATISAFFPAVNLRVCVSSEGLPEPRNTIPKVDEGKKSEI